MYIRDLLIFMPAAGLRDKGPDIKEAVVQCCWIKGLCTDRVHNSPGVHYNCILWFPLIRPQKVIHTCLLLHTFTKPL